ncbi:hypothetical protein HFN89_04040 [Rhizobium laguerreae]|nr:hypothetical protein [Rhizobium laguerreae]
MSYYNPTASEYLAPLMFGAEKWATQNLTYSLTGSLSEMTNSVPPFSGTYIPFLESDPFLGKLTSIVKTWDDLIPGSISKTEDVDNANIHIARTDNEPRASFGGTPYSSNSGDFWLSLDIQGNSDLAPINSSNWQAASHEFGHVLGLSHSGYYDISGAAPTVANNYQDSNVYSIMSYFGPNRDAFADVQMAEWKIGNDPYFAQTPMMNDITAIRQLYGELDQTTRSEDGTIYGFGSNITGASADIFNFILPTDAGIGNKTPILCIYDAGGTGDVLNLSGWSTRSAISLIPGTFSNTNGMTMNISIARETTIENAVGGSGSDVILGNDTHNILVGNAGDDILFGGKGDDNLFGGQGNDILVGGLPGIDQSLVDAGYLTADLAAMWDAFKYTNETSEFDTANYAVVYAGMTSGITVDMSRATKQVVNDGYGTSDTLYSIERIIGTGLADTISLMGATKGMEAAGSGGDDDIFDSAYADVLRGEADNDTIHYSLGRDSLYGGTGINTLMLDKVSQATSTQTVIDIVAGKVTIGAASAGNVATFWDFQRFVGSNLDDKFIFKNGTTWIDGAGGNNTVDFSQTSGALVIDLAAGHVTCGGAFVTDLANVQHAIGATGADYFLGTDGTNVFTGGNGDDIFQGRSGADTFYGGANIDRASYIDSQFGVRIDLSSAIQHGGDAEGDRYDSIEGAWGSESRDVLIGSANVGTFNWFAGGGGNDDIFLWAPTGHTHGGFGNDLIVHNGGGQEIWGNDDADTFRFAGKSFSYGSQNTYLHDYTHGVDVIEFTNGVSAADITVDAVGTSARVTVGSYGYFFIDNAAHFGLTSGDFLFA